MSLARGRRYITDESVLTETRRGIKLEACPHCGRVGALIGHGLLRGYAEGGPEWVVRGRRFFCSNRYRRPGCGRTFSVLLGGVIAGFVVGALTLFRFVELVIAGTIRRTAWQIACAAALSVSSGYRLWRRVSGAQSALRTRLCRECPPPACAHAEPLAGLLGHFRAALPNASCPFSEYQVRFGCGLLD